MNAFFSRLGSVLGALRVWTVNLLSLLVLLYVVGVIVYVVARMPANRLDDFHISTPLTRSQLMLGHLSHGAIGIGAREITKLVMRIMISEPDSMNFAADSFRQSAD